MPPRRRRSEPITAERIDIFLEIFATTGHAQQACKAAEISFTAMMLLKKTNHDFAVQYDLAYEMANTILEDEMVRRGVKGVLKPVFYRGVKVAMVREYSDQLLALLAKGRMKRVYGDQLGLTHGGQIGVQPFDYNEAIGPITTPDPDEV